jgi:exodeoxyribonuclease-3
LAATAILRAVKLCTWNVNSVRQRLPRLLAFLERESPDILCLQELKCVGEDFPFEELRAVGYAATVHGQRASNGVAILSRSEPAGVVRGFEGDPVPQDARVVSATVSDVRVVCVYVVNGKDVLDPAYQVKLTWLDAFRAWVESSFVASEPLIAMGDFNIGPDDRDVWDPVAWRGQNLVSEPERQRFRGLLDWGLVDLGRKSAGDVEGPFTFWDYRAGAFHKNMGLRIDLALATEPVATRLTSVTVDRNERKPTSGEGKPSDHAPLIVTLQ